VHKASVREIVVAMMQEQHKEMMKDLVHGRIPSVQEFLGKPKVPVTAPEVAKSPRVPPRPRVAVPTLDTTNVEEKTLDELIMEFLSNNESKSKT
jgi:hypothetical protein